MVGSAPAVDPERAVGGSQQQERRSLRAACCRILTWEVRIGLVTDSLMVEVESGVRRPASCVPTGRQPPARPRRGHFPGAHILCHLMVMLGQAATRAVPATSPHLRPFNHSTFVRHLPLCAKCCDRNAKINRTNFWQVHTQEEMAVGTKSESPDAVGTPGEGATLTSRPGKQSSLQMVENKEMKAPRSNVSPFLL